MDKQVINKLLRRIVTISYEKKLSHIGSCVTALPIIYEIYKTRKQNEPFILSSGHAGLALYCVLEEIYGIDAEYLFDKHGVHPNRDIDNQIWCSTGSLGHGIGIAIGMALADRSKDVYCLLSDGELAEGSVYESLRIKRENNLDNLKVYVNDNGWGAYRRTAFNYRWDDETFQVRKTNMLNYPEYLQGQMAHYKVLNEKEYKELMKILK